MLQTQGLLGFELPRRGLHYVWTSKATFLWVLRKYPCRIWAYIEVGTLAIWPLSNSKHFQKYWGKKRKKKGKKWWISPYGLRVDGIVVGKNISFGSFRVFDEKDDTKDGSLMKVSLNCIEWKLDFWRNGVHLTKDKSVSIERNKTYYQRIEVCSNSQDKLTKLEFLQE